MEKKHTPILTGLKTLESDRDLELEVVPLVLGQWSVKENEWLETLKIFGNGKEDGRKIKIMCQEGRRWNGHGLPDTIVVVRLFIDTQQIR